MSVELLSEQQIIDCANASDLEAEQQIIDCANASDLEAVFRYVHERGLATDADYPYTGKPEECLYSEGDVSVRTTEPTAVALNNSLALKAAVASGPVASAIRAESDAFRFYRGGLFSQSDCSGQMVQAVVIVGYGYDCEGDYFIAKNSWGMDWGDSGYIYVLDDEDACGLLAGAVFSDPR